MEPLLLCLMIIHGAIHFLGLIKAFRIAQFGQVGQKLTRAQGVFWAVSGCLFIISAILLALHYDCWWVVSFTAIATSQYLIIKDWHDARFGTLPNALILSITLLGFFVWSVMSN